MAETTADVRRDIELTRERMSDTLSQLEKKVNVVQVVKDNPWPALAIAAGAGFLLATSKVDLKSAAATVAATGGASSRVGGLLDDVSARLITGVTSAVHGHVDGWIDEIKQAIGAPGDTRGDGAAQRTSRSAAMAGDRQGMDVDRGIQRSDAMPQTPPSTY